jgi:hypothetical protein
MFEAEVALEKRSSILPFLLMLCLLAVVLGGVVWFGVQMWQRKPLTAEQAGPIVATALQHLGPSVTRFRTGLVTPGGDVKPGDPNYRLLAKAGLVKLAKPAKGGSVQVTLTPQGEQMLAGISGVKKSQEKDGTTSYQVPLANKQLVGVTGVTMSGINMAAVAYTWKWAPNPLADVFDAGGPLLKSFNTWDRQNLINKYGAAFYHGDASRSTIALTRDGRTWKIAAP